MVSGTEYRVMAAEHHRTCSNERVAMTDAAISLHDFINTFRDSAPEDIRPYAQVICREYVHANRHPAHCGRRGGAVMTLTVVRSGQDPNEFEIEYELTSLERQARAIWMMSAALEDDDPDRWAFKQVAEDMEDRIRSLKRRLGLD
jgi:hypothetical protein